MPFGAVAGALAAAAPAIGAAGAAISAGTAIAGAVGGSGSVDSAAGQANAISQQAVADAKANYAPYMSAGTGALSQQNALLGLNGPDAASAAMSSFEASPGYQYQVDQGLRAVDAGAASKGMLRSGATLKAEQTLGSNLANQDFGAYLGRLNALSSLGMQATSGLTNAELGQSNNQQQTTVSAGSQDASIFGNAANQLGGTATQFAKNSLFSAAGTGTSGSGATYNTAGYSANDLAAINNPYNY